MNPPLLNAFDQGLIYPIMTVYLEHGERGCTGRFSSNAPSFPVCFSDKQFKYGGVVTYGGVDKTHCGEMIAYERTTRDAKMWQFMVASRTLSRQPSQRMNGSFDCCS